MRMLSVITGIVCISIFGYIVCDIKNNKTPAVNKLTYQRENTILQKSDDIKAVEALTKAYDILMRKADEEYFYTHQMALIATKRLFDDIENGQISDSYLDTDLPDIIPNINLISGLGQSSKQLAIKQAYDITLATSVEYEQLRVSVLQIAQGLIDCLDIDTEQKIKKRAKDFIASDYNRMLDSANVANTAYLIKLLYGTDNETLSRLSPIIKLNNIRNEYFYTETRIPQDEKALQFGVQLMLYMGLEEGYGFFLPKLHAILLTSLPQNLASIFNMGTDEPLSIINQAELLMYEKETNHSINSIFIGWRAGTKLENIFKKAGLDMDSYELLSEEDFKKLLISYDEAIGNVITRELKRAGGRGNPLPNPPYCYGKY